MGNGLKDFNQSNKSKEQQPKAVQPVEPVNGELSTWQEFKQLFTPRDFREVWRDILLHNIGPNLKNGAINLFKNMIDMAFGNKVAPQENRTKYSSASQTMQTMQTTYTQNNGNPYYRPTFKSYQEAVDCANEMIETMNEGKSYSVAEVYQRAGITPRPEFYNYGWIQIVVPDPIQCIGGWMIPLSSPKCFK